MPFLNIEIKAKSSNASFIRNWLQQNGADFKGTDKQTDTYFCVNKGRLKLREGNIENNLIFYERKEKIGLKNSHFHLLKVTEPAVLKEILKNAMGIKVVVEKKREIYYISNVKFHIDEVDGLGSFIEIEAGNVLEDISKEKLEEQCSFYMKEFGIKEEDLIAQSYSDMLLAKISG